jgi:hypothetical protein
MGSPPLPKAREGIGWLSPPHTNKSQVKKNLEKKIMKKKIIKIRRFFLSVYFFLEISCIYHFLFIYLFSEFNSQMAGVKFALLE